jgi:hypothetical protein
MSICSKRLLFHKAQIIKKKDWFEIGIMRPSGDRSLPADCWFNELAI